MTPPSPEEELKVRAEEFRFDNSYAARIIRDLLARVEALEHLDAWADDVISQLASVGAGNLPEAVAKLQRLEAAERKVQAMEAYVQHKDLCAAMCSECGKREDDGNHRKHWRNGSGVFWHEFTPFGKCTCGLDALLTGQPAEKEKP